MKFADGGNDGVPVLGPSVICMGIYRVFVRVCHWRVRTDSNTGKTIASSIHRVGTIPTSPSYHYFIIILSLLGVNLRRKVIRVRVRPSNDLDMVDLERQLRSWRTAMFVWLIRGSSASAPALNRFMAIERCRGQWA